MRTRTAQCSGPFESNRLQSCGNPRTHTSTILCHWHHSPNGSWTRVQKLVTRRADRLPVANVLAVSRVPLPRRPRNRCTRLPGLRIQYHLWPTMAPTPTLCKAGGLTIGLRIGCLVLESSACTLISGHRYPLCQSRRLGHAPLRRPMS